MSTPEPTPPTDPPTDPAKAAKPVLVAKVAPSRIPFGPATTPPDRGAGLALPPRPLAAVPPPATLAPPALPGPAPAPGSPAPAVAAETVVAGRPARGRAARGDAAPPARRRRPAPEPEPEGPISDGVGVHLGTGLARRLRAFSHTHPERPYTTIALDAVAMIVTSDRLTTLFPNTPQRTDGVFVGRRPRVVRHTDDRTQITLRPSPEDRATLDRLAAETPGCPNRSALIAAALDAYLPPG